jgi:ferric-dicitrate binding protein FerR (iron transport regulator)
MEPRDELELSPEQERVAEALRSLAAVEPSARFRDRLKSDFVAGRLGAPAAAPKRRRFFGLRPRQSALVLSAAAVAVCVLVIVGLNRGPQLVVADVTGTGTLTIDGVSAQATDRTALQRLIRPRSRIELPEGVELDLVHGETVIYQLAASTVMTLPERPGRWFGREVESRLETGELRVLTGRDYAGVTMHVETPEGHVQIAGTLVSVFREDPVTCVCVYSGTAEVGIDSDDMQPIQPGTRKVMFSDGRPPMITEIAPPHRDHLIEFETKYRSWSPEP